MEYKKVKAVLKVEIEVELTGTESDEETVRYLVEQDLQDAGYEVEISVLNDDFVKE